MKRRECVYKEAKKEVPPIQISDVDNLCGVVSTFWFAMGVFFHAGFNYGKLRHSSAS